MGLAQPYKKADWAQGLSTMALVVGLSFIPSLAYASDVFDLGAGFMPDPQLGEGVTGGPRAATTTYGMGCAGQIAEAPNHTLDVTSEVDLKIYAVSDSDATLVVVGPNVTLCDDDGHGGLNPEVSAVFTPGRYEVYVGDFNQEAASYVLTVTENL